MFSKEYRGGRNNHLQHADPLFAEMRELSPFRRDSTASSTIQKPLLHSLNAAHTKNESGVHEACRIHYGVDPDHALNVSPSLHLMTTPVPPPSRESRWGMGSLWATQLHCDSLTESLQRRIIELERENAFLRITLLESSERRTRQRFSVAGASHSAPMPSTDGARPRELLHCIREMERETTRHFEMEMERMRKQHMVQVRLVEGGSERKVLGNYESVFAEAERRRWKEHARQAVEEIAQLHREREQRALSTNTNGLERRNECEKHAEVVNMQRMEDLEQQIQYWKSTAEREKARANMYQREAMQELRRMHTAYQAALGTQDPQPSIEPNFSSPTSVSLPHPAPALTKDVAKEGGEGGIAEITSTEIEKLPTSWTVASPSSWKADSAVVRTTDFHKSSTANISPGTTPTITRQTDSILHMGNPQHNAMRAGTPVAASSDRVGAGISPIPASPAFTQMQAALKSNINDLMVYMNAMHISPEEKAAVSGILAAVTQYTQSRLRLDQYGRESELCLQQLNQLSSSIDMTFSETGSTSSTNAFMECFLFPQNGPTAAGAFASAASPQNTGKARVDADLSECRGLLQQVESLARTFQDLQQRRANVLAFFHPDSKAATTGGDPDVSNIGFSVAPTPLMTSLVQVQEAVVGGVATLRRLVEQKVSALFAAESGGSNSISGGETEGHNANADNNGARMRTALQQLCDTALGRVEIMRSRITRLGAARIEEAEALERLLRSMDSYDPALTERVGRRAQIDAELEDLRSWLASLGTLRQRALTLTETLQQTMTDDEDVRMFQAVSAASSARPSVGGTVPGNLEEWRRALILPDAPATITHSETVPAVPREEDCGDNESLRNIMSATAITAAPVADADADAVPSTEAVLVTDTAAADVVPVTADDDDAVPVADTAADAVPVTDTAFTPTSTVIATTVDSATGAIDDVSNGNAESIKESGNKAAFDKDTLQSARNVVVHSYRSEWDTVENADIVNEDDENSQFHANAFDDDCHLPQRSGYLGVIKSFIGAVAQRATTFSDSEDSEPEAESGFRGREARKRRRH